MLSPIPGKDYPRTWSEFLDRFATEEACLDYVKRLCWPDGFACPACGAHAEPYRASRLRLMCRSCRHQTSVTTDTIFQKTRTPLRVWQAAAWYVTNQKLGVSALGLRRVLGLGSYQTAWTLLHRLHRAMVRPERDKLQGLVEIDEPYLAITDRLVPESAKGRKSKSAKVVVAIAVEILTPRGFGRIRLRRIEDDSAASMIPFVRDVVDPASVVCTDGSPAYLDLKSLGFEHERKVMLGSDLAAHVLMPGVHRVASLLKRWILGHTPRCGPARPTRPIPGRVRISLLPPNLPFAGLALLPVDGAGRQGGAGHLCRCRAETEYGRRKDRSASWYFFSA